ncbi:MAG: cysteine hydrolase family protein [Rubrobacter sp.]
MARTVEVPEYEVQAGVRVDPRRTALIVGDMQNDFVKEGGTLVVPDAEGTIPPIRRLLGLARESGMKVVFTQDTHNDGDPEWEIWGEHCREESWGWQVVDELAPREDEATVRKPRYDAFYGTQLEHTLRLWGVDTLIICGTVANICVFYTAAGAAMRWFEVVVPKDCISSFNDFDMEVSLSQTAILLGEVVGSGDIEIGEPETTEVYRSKLEEAAALVRGR